MKSFHYVTVAVLAAAAGFAIYRFGIEPNIVGKPGMMAEQAPSEPSIESTMPSVLPDFTLADLSGEPRSILSWPGKSMIVNFWATWCAPCRREIPLLKSIQQEHAEEGFQVVGVAVDFREDVLEYAKEIGIDYPVLIGEQDGLEAVGKFGQGSLGLPFTVFTDSQHRIVAFHLGEIEPSEADVLLDAVRRVNSGELTPAAARTVAAKQLAAL